MKTKIDKRFVVDMGGDNDIPTRSRYDKEVETKLIHKDTFVLLLDSCGVSQVYYVESTQHFAVMMHGPYDQVWISYFEDIIYALMKACLLTTCPTIDLLIEEFGNEYLAPFVSPCYCSNCGGVGI